MDQKSWFYEKINALMPILSKNFHSQKNTLLPFPYFVKKTSILSKIECYHAIFINNFIKNPCYHAHIQSKKRQICQNYKILWAKKVNRLPFFPHFSRKKQCSHAHILSKKRPISKKHTALMPIFCQKNVPYLKNTLLSCIFFLFFS